MRTSASVLAAPSPSTPTSCPTHPFAPQSTAQRTDTAGPSSVATGARTTRHPDCQTAHHDALPVTRIS